MNIAELAEVIAYRHDLPKKAARVIVDSVFAVLTEATIADREVTLSGFGKFRLRTSSARVGRNLRTGELMDIKPAPRISFAPAKSFKDKLVRR
ncbi:HU family DNA-binding protein [Sphingomonas sp. OTU376]|uniref:HU family DNA-binding protein n=1 Tax=Sphingomonas sp. OTU376 TaxID=3043863 RepID=UPI00313C71D8